VEGEGERVGKAMTGDRSDRMENEQVSGAFSFLYEDGWDGDDRGEGR
jgi:hypothetical protein